MESVEKIYSIIKDFSDLVNKNKKLEIHKENNFNKQFSNLLKEWNYIKIITARINNANPTNDITQLGLDLKTLYVFVRVFSESLIYISSLFIPSSSKIKWNKLGPFIKSVKENIGSESEQLKNFWKNCESYINNLNELSKYRNYVLHEKGSSTEWTLSNPVKSNLDSIRIYNVPWREDRSTKKEERTLNTRDIINNLYIESSNIINYLKSTVS